MKQSEIIKAQLQGEDNDLKALGISTKVIREERSERFEDTWLPKLERKFKVSHNEEAGRYTFTSMLHGIIDFYPKANNLLIRRKNKWIKPGLNWIIKNFELNK